MKSSWSFSWLGLRISSVKRAGNVGNTGWLSSSPPVNRPMTASPNGKGRKKTPNKDDNYTFRSGSFLKKSSRSIELPGKRVYHTYFQPMKDEEISQIVQWQLQPWVEWMMIRWVWVQFKLTICQVLRLKKIIAESSSFLFTTESQNTRLNALLFCQESDIPSTRLSKGQSYFQN